MRRRTVLAALCAATLSACGGIATSGPVEEVPMSAQPGGIDIAPRPPEPGVMPARIVEGFVQAMADPTGDYAVARQYLTQEAAGSWDPETAQIYSGSITGDAEGARIDAILVGQLDATGHYTSRAAQFSHDFALVQEQGEWRIASAPDGLLLSRYIFERYYGRVSLYFMSRAGTHVVPEPIHLPESLVTPTAVITAMLEGPSAALANAVTTAVPAGVRLGEDGATIDTQGVVTVDLSGLSDSLGDDARRRLGAQLIWSLTSIPRVTGVIVTNEGALFSIPGATAEGVLELASQQGYQVLSRGSGAELFGVRDGQPGVLEGASGFQPGEAPIGPVADVAHSLDGVSVAYIGVGRDTLSLGATNGQLLPIDTGLSNLRSPQFVLGSLWLMGDDGAGRPQLVTVDRDGRVERVTVEAPAGELEAFAVSPTRARIAVVTNDAGARSLGVVTLLPDSGRTEAWRELQLVSSSGQQLTDPRSMAWLAETSLTLIAGAGAQPSVYSVEVDGSLLEDIGPLTGEPAEVTAMARLGGGSIAVRTTADVVWRYEARTRWTRVADAISAICYGG